MVHHSGNEKRRVCQTILYYKLFYINFDFSYLNLLTFLTLLVMFWFLPVIKFYSHGKNTFEMFHNKNLFHSKSYLINSLLYKRYLYWVSCFKRSWLSCKSNEFKLIRDHISKWDKSNYSSNNNSVIKNFETILKESYWGL